MGPTTSPRTATRTSVAADAAAATAHTDRSGRSTPRSICLYTPSVNPSGMGSHMLDLAAEYVRWADVTVMAWATPPGRRLLDQASALGARVLPLPRPRDPDFGATITRDLLAHPVDVFHIHVGTGRENWDGARAARRAGVPAVVQTEHLPWLYRDHRKIERLLRALEPVDHVIAVSEAQRETYERVGVPPERLTTVLNGIRPRGRGIGRGAARTLLGLRPDQLVVLNVGRLIAQKGQRYLLDAVPGLAASFPDLAVVVLGQGPLHEQLRAQAAALGIAQRVHLPGYRADARLLLDAADVFVLPSLQEGMPLAALEAMDAGLPVVATRVIGTSEVVADRQTGRLVPARDPEALAVALAELLGDPQLRARYARAGRERYLEHFTNARMAAETAAVYGAVLAAAEGGRRERARRRAGVSENAW